MDAKLPVTPTGWVDPDDAPELTQAWFDQAVPMIGERVVSRAEMDAAVTQRQRGRPHALVKRPMLSMRVDPDVLAALRASGKGWQTKVNALLRPAVEKGLV